MPDPTSNETAKVALKAGLRLPIPDWKDRERVTKAVEQMISSTIRGGQHTTVTAADTIETGLATVLSATATLEDDPGDDPLLVTAQIGNQAGAPAAGSIILKTWKTDGTDPTPVAATTFGKKVNWVAVGE